MSNKTIKINPSLFIVGGLSKKNKLKKNKSMSAPLISPNILKNKLLKRIKEHKNKETINLTNNKTTLSSEITKNNTNPIINSYTDEFNDSLEYLQTLSKQKKTETENNIKRNAIQKKTIKSYTSSMPAVNLELPDELKETFVTVNNNETNIPNISIPNISIPVLKNDVPYGILKGGNKPTYRQWNKTQKNNNNTLIQSSPINKRESRLNLLKQKLKRQSTIVTQPQTYVIPTQVIPTQVMPTQVIPTQVIPTQVIPTQVIPTQENLEEILLTQNLIQKPQNIITQNSNINIQQNMITGGHNENELKEPEKNRTTKKLFKKTIHKKYTLGKSKIKRTVGVLLKDKNTRKNILNAQKYLRDKSVNDVKTYLRKHNLIKIGSNAPNDVIRKIYESAMLAGEITNNNKDTMIHNFIKEDT